MERKENDNELIKNINLIHTTKLGIERIKRNLCLDTDDVVSWCMKRILDYKSVIFRKGKNFYIHIDDSEITVNANSYTIITAHKLKK